MIIVMAPHSTEEEFQAVIERIQLLGYRAHVIRGVERTVIGAVGHEDKSHLPIIEQMKGVEAVIPILKPFKLASAEWKQQRTTVRVGDVVIGGDEIVIIAGPGVVESEAQVLAAAEAVRAAGAKLFRGCVYSYYMSPYTQTEFDPEKLSLLRRVREETGLPVVTEVFSAKDLDAIAQTADMIQIGARNSQNFSLLRLVGRLRKPVFLKRGMSLTIREFIMAAEYILSEGNSEVVLCERGIRTFESETPFSLDLNAVPVIKGQCHLPVFVDPSHGTGRRHLVAAMARAAVAAGADGLMIEVHPHPDQAVLDGAQSLRPEQFADLMPQLRRIAEAVGRKI
ncbi:MAG: 3-deoxy-7-phosphoheptulonate synthase [Candidatus Sumerlaeia bacterium]|nr:3-deoxy-7-phosphoheptulonate synthase [Candidatus Sumerlaeia bacterium]